MKGQLCLDLEKLIANEISSLGFEFVKLEIDSNNKTNILRVYANTVGGITINDCGKISYHLNKVLSVSEELHLSDYILEVSSPGIN